MKNKLFLSFCSLALLISSTPVSAEISVYCDTADSLEVSNLVKDNWEDDYYSEALLNVNTNKVSVDGVTKKATAVYGKDIKDSLDSVEEVKEYFEDTPYDVEIQSNSTLKITSPYQTKRIVVLSNSLDSNYGASQVLNNSDYNQYILQFDTEEATEKAYNAIVKKYDCFVDEVLSLEDVGLTAYTDVTRDPALAWGTSYSGLTEFRNKKFNPKVTVAIIDTGCYASDFFEDSSRISPLSYDFTASSSEVTDKFGHGTSVAGIVYDNTPTNVEIMNLRVFDDTKKSTWVWLNSALQYAVDNNADIINMSLGQVSEYAASFTQLNAALQKAEDNGVIVCAAAGNDSIDVNKVYPACTSYTLAISGINSVGQFDSSYSNYGDLIDFAAPGTAIMGPSKNNTYATSSGTSMASPYVASALATVKSIKPSLSGDNLVEEVKKYTVDLGEAGRDAYYGEGYINLKDYKIHNYKVTTKPATCTEEGKKIYVCEDCGDTYEEKIDNALGHDYVDTVVPSTCKDKGYTEHTCSRCGDTYKDTYTNTTPHTPGDEVEENFVDSSCTNVGSKDVVVYCSKCGTELSRTSKEVPVKGHSFGDWEETSSPTCTGVGSKHRVCSVCNFEEVADVDATGHTWNTDYTVDKPATCTSQGSKSIHCANCDAVKDSTVIDMLGHDYNEGVVTKEATCSSEGEKSYTCKVCGDVKIAKTPINPAAHDINEVVTPATCSQRGYTTITCKRCGYTRQDNYTDKIPHTIVTETNVITPATCTERGKVQDIEKCSVCNEVISTTGRELDMKEHNYGGWATTKEPSCTESGLKERTCQDCGHVDTEVIEAFGHTKSEPIKENEVAATCTKGGSYESVIKCTVCGKEISRETINVAALGHTKSEPIKENEVVATCTKGGSYESVIKCAVCGKELNRETVNVDALGHTESEPIKENEVAATCTEKGSYESVKKCTVCGKEISREVIKTNALGHTESEPIKENEVAATCTKEGSYESVIKCTVCGKEISREVIKTNALGHSFSDWKEVSEATCKTTGSSQRVCKVCGYTETKISEVKAHEWDKDFTIDKEATYTEDGSKSIHCKNCEAVKDSQVIPRLEQVSTDKTNAGENASVATTSSDKKASTDKETSAGSNARYVKTGDINVNNIIIGVSLLLASFVVMIVTFTRAKKSRNK